jgi:hypothetical protein
MHYHVSDYGAAGSYCVNVNGVSVAGQAGEKILVIDVEAA